MIGTFRLIDLPGIEISVCRLLRRETSLRKAKIVSNPSKRVTDQLLAFKLHIITENIVHATILTQLIKAVETLKSQEILRVQYVKLRGRAKDKI